MDADLATAMTNEEEIEEYRRHVSALEAYAWRKTELDKARSDDWRQVASHLCAAHNACQFLSED